MNRFRRTVTDIVFELRIPKDGGGAVSHAFVYECENNLGRTVAIKSIMK